MKRFLAVLFLLAAQPVLACVPAIAVTPSRPTTYDEIEVALNGVCGSSCVPHTPKVTIAAGTITVDFQQFTGGCLTVITRWGDRVRFGPVPAGEHVLVVRKNGEEMTRTPLTVRDHPMRIRPSFGPAGTEVLIVHGDATLYCPTTPCDFPQVTFGGAAATVVRRSEDSVVAVAPDHAPGLADVVLTGQSGKTVTATQAYLYPHAQSDLGGEYERVFFPIVFEGPGAHGSQWTTNNSVRNDSPIRIDTVNTTLPPYGTVQLPINSNNGGDFLWVPRGLEMLLGYSSHIVDRARRSLNAGTEIPVVKMRQGSPRLSIVGVPLTAESRQTLRIFDLDAAEERLVRVNVMLPDREALTIAATLTGVTVCVTTPCYPVQATHAVINLDAVPELRGAGTADIEITTDSTRNDARLWALVSVTNNDTQHVTTYTPQHPRRPFEHFSIPR